MHNEVIIPATRRLVGLLGIRLEELQVREILNNPVLGGPTPRTVRHLAKQLNNIRAEKQNDFVLSWQELAAEAIKIDCLMPNNIFYVEGVYQEAHLLAPMPLTELGEILNALDVIRSIPARYPHAPELSVALVLAVLRLLRNSFPCIAQDLLSPINYLVNTSGEQAFREIARCVYVG